MEVDIEAALSDIRVSRGTPQANRDIYLDSSQDGCFVHVMITGIDNAPGLGPTLLSRSNGSPKNSFSATTSITEPSQQPNQSKAQIAYQKG
jgi:hypothetical protein